MSQSPIRSAGEVRSAKNEVQSADPNFVLRSSNFALPALIAFLCYANSLGNGFAYDDIALVRDNPRLRDVTDLRAIFLTDWWQPQTPEAAIELKQRDRLYRPLTLFTLALNHAAHALAPFGYHLVNVLLHAAATALVFAFALRLSGHRAVAWITALAFAVHPVHVEAVANVVGRAEILACIGLLAGCIALRPPSRRESNSGAPGEPSDEGAMPTALRRHVPRWPSLRRQTVASFAFLAALLAKETAACYPALALAFLYFGNPAGARDGRAVPESKPPGRRCGAWLLSLALLLWPLAVYFPLRYIALDGHLLRDRAPSDLLNALTLADGWQRVWMSVDVLGHYARLLILPQKLSCSYGFAVLDPQRGPGILTWVGLLAVIVLLFGLAGFRSPRPLRRTAAIAAALFLASYALISNTLLLIGVDVAERLFYWPSVPLLLLIACAIVDVWERHAQPGGNLSRVAPALRIAGYGLLAALAVRTLVRNPDWTDNRIFELDARTYPRAAVLHAAAAKELLRSCAALPPEQCQERAAQADAATARALGIQPHYVDALVVRARARAILGDFAAARELARSALGLDATHAGARDVLGRLSAEQAAPELTLLEQQVATQPANPTTRKQLATALLQAGRFADARSHLEQAVSSSATDGVVHRLLGDALMGLAEPQLAQDAYERALALTPEDWQAHSNLVGLLASKRPQAALEHARTAHRLAPTEFTTILNLAQMLGQLERWEEALTLYEQLRRGLPADSSLRPVIEDRIRSARNQLQR